jgi:hypothetical protein
MTESRSKSDPISETTKSHLADKYISARFGRQTDIHTKYMKKGLMVEEDSITLYSRVKKEFFKKNEFTLSNDYISGTPDLFTGTIIHEADTIIDIKSSWDIFTFFRTTQDKLNKQYYWQLQGYMALTGASSAKLVYCLVNTPEQLVFDEINKLKWKLGVINPETDENFKKAAAEIEKAANYDDVPMDERVNEIHVERNEEDIARIYDRVKQCRVYMNEQFFKNKQPLEAVAR